MKGLAGYRELDHDKIQTGYIDWLLEDNGLLARLKVKELKGNGLKYNIRTGRGTAAWTQPNETIVTTTGTTEQRSAAIYSLVKQADVDKFAIATNASQDPTIAELKESADDMTFSLTRAMVHGQTTASGVTNEAKGLFQLTAEIEGETKTDLDGSTTPGAGNNSQVVAAHATSVVLTLDMVDMLNDVVKLGINCYVCSRAVRRKLTSLARAATGNVEHDKDELGYMVDFYGGKPLYIVDEIEDAYPDNSSSALDISSYVLGTTIASGNDNCVLFALNTSENGFVMLQSQPLKREGPWTPDDVDANRYRFTWYVGFGLLNKLAVGLLTGFVVGSST